MERTVHELPNHRGGVTNIQHDIMILVEDFNEFERGCEMFSRLVMVLDKSVQCKWPCEFEMSELVI